ncbi:aminotransferase class I/II-fold pyridoxal phosphate-dependent enzyme [Larkinella terrae]|uniref:Aminotransferase class I/II-fold pyridoxal phosphate-dependent enzyme n=1 Tax=Larkinella terrae TaxID=2025311 RepID=A0A7K0EXG0_9BACT|nr:8-amino-7-oxononanoate synthase [Larkinella terrae]MRS65878.1 aminotransferase class I/II-fold pyridoxal phosphate-dependent enzyme [Larkinella terrae]
MIRAEKSIQELLEKRRAAGLLRSLKKPENVLDFCSNDYLGLARSAVLRHAIEEAIRSHSSLLNGSTGSRLLAGNSALAEELETEIAAFHETEAALIFNSGYDANVGLLACLPQRGDTLLTDELIHASMIDGARLSVASRFKFKHNDLADLENRLQRATGTVFVAIESVYSMDGDLAPLPEIVDLCERYEAALIVDEAHATGVFGPKGEGLVQALGLQNRVFARVHTFGKALGVHGAAVVGSTALRDFLINFARSFVYSTALPPHSLLAIRCVYRFLPENEPLIARLHSLRAYFQQQIQEQLPQTEWTSAESPILGLIVPGNDACRQVASQLQQAGFDIRPILSPTVPAGRERLRICLHAFNSENEIDALVQALQKIGMRSGRRGD